MSDIWKELDLTLGEEACGSFIFFMERKIPSYKQYHDACKWGLQVTSTGLLAIEVHSSLR